MESGPAVMRRYRKEQKVSQDTLARLANVSVSAVSQIERGVHGASRETAEALDKALGASGELLVAFGYTNDPTPTDDITKVLDLARTMRVGLETSKSRDDKLDQIIALCTTLTSNQADMVRRLTDNAARIEALLAHFGLEAVPVSSEPE